MNFIRKLISAVVSETSAADSPSEVSSPPVPPSEGRSGDAAAEWVGEAVPVISAVLAGHRFYIESTDKPHTYTYHCATPLGALHKRFESQGYPGACDQWVEHVAPLIANALAPQPKPAFETGLDMGARLDGASAMFPQSTKHQKK